LAGLWDQLVRALVALAGRASRTATLLAYNLLVHDGRLAIIAFPRVVDVIANPRGAFYLTRDAENMGRWFAARGLVGVRRGPGTLPPCSAGKPCLRS
jgi:RIO kinase 1